MSEYKMQIIKIKGKEYIPVNERLKYFRKHCATGSIETEMVSNENGICIFKATVFKDKEIVATGHAYEKDGSSFINKTSYIENCETSAVGRALGILGIGIDTSLASADEINNAEKNKSYQLMTKEQSDEFIEFCKVNKLDPKEIAIEYSITKKMRKAAFELTFGNIKKDLESGDIGYKFITPDEKG